MQAIRTEAGTLWNGTVAPALVLDLDGTVRYNKNGDDFISSPDDIALFPDVEAKIWEYRDKGYLILGISNQGGVAFGYKTWQNADAELEATLSLFKANPFHLVEMCYHHEGGTKFPYNKRSLFRKPNIGMLAAMEAEAFGEGYLIDWDNSLFVGDRDEDRQCAANAGIPFQWAKDFFGRE
jgi:D-glycero-D-manno-heptose 1,7-bisphosphate phosphatase